MSELSEHLVKAAHRGTKEVMNRQWDGVASLDEEIRGGLSAALRELANSPIWDAHDVGILATLADEIDRETTEADR